MSQLIVEPVVTRRQQEQFITLPWDLYQGDPNWVPPLLAEHWRLLGYRKHPFHEINSVRTFLATRGGKPVGRVAAIVNRAHNERYDEQRGFFGWFESIDEQEVTDKLFAAAGDWLRAQGMTAVRGPANPSLNYECGLLIDGFHSPPTFMMTYNKPYYGRLIEGAGFKKVTDMYAFWGHMEMLAQIDKKLFFIVNESKSRFNVTVRAMDRSRFRQEVEMFLRVYNESLVGTWGFAPLSAGEIDELAKGLKHLIVPELAMVAEVEGRPIGACFALLDYNPRIKQIDGRLFPLGFLKLISNKRAIKKMRVISINVVPEYQRWGLGVVLLAGLVKPLRAWGMHEVEFSWVVENNTLSRGSLEKGGAKLDKTYRMYDRDL